LIWRRGASRRTTTGSRASAPARDAARPHAASAWATVSVLLS
jgi:hypothetical protein